ncbi:CXXC-type zinc finger protein 1-like [Frankliniella occidentalis]|uniref:CXXC-type zinc finger protein 1-like n=1 Tax=Frankliniella occidentalis TaxID=133901 RepID=A0A6J1TCP7_FRAOC|nr:CXXC-type zinc finger protein 1-like [Frankliniella occidentalis]
MYCMCRKPAGSRFMIGCDNCDEWFHGNCIGVSPKQKLPDKWCCPKCFCDSNAKRILLNSFAQ